MEVEKSYVVKVETKDGEAFLVRNPLTGVWEPIQLPKVESHHEKEDGVVSRGGHQVKIVDNVWLQKHLVDEEGTKRCSRKPRLECLNGMHDAADIARAAREIKEKAETYMKEALKQANDIKKRQAFRKLQRTKILDAKGFLEVLRGMPVG